MSLTQPHTYTLSLSLSLAVPFLPFLFLSLVSHKTPLHSPNQLKTHTLRSLLVLVFFLLYPLTFTSQTFSLCSDIPACSFQNVMPSSESGESRRPSNPQNPAGAPPPAEQEHLPCPRCDSTNTKFCYYNNYNFSQPRHFCKSCRRYWTHGGTLRDIPVGGGSRKNAKRSRTVSATTSSSSSAAVISASSAAPPAMVPVAGNQGASMQFGGVVVDGDGKANNVNVCGGNGSFTSLLSNNQGPTGFLALGGFGLGLGPGLEDVGFGMGRAGWPFPGVADGGSIGVGVASSGVGNTWQFESGEGGFVGGDCFSWPGLAISTPGNSLK